jgi:hypothetical protein
MWLLILIAPFNPLIYPVAGYRPYIVSKKDNCIYLFTPDSICKLSKTNPDDRSTIIKFNEKLEFFSLYETDTSGIYGTCTNKSVYLLKNNLLTKIGTPMDSATILVRLLDSQNRLFSPHLLLVNKRVSFG